MSKIVQKTLLGVHIFMDGGELVHGDIYLAEGEMAEEVLNHEDPFLIVKVETGTRMVNKSVMAKVIIRDETEKTLSIELVPHEKVLLTLRNGEAYEGAVLLRKKFRVSSEINSGISFAPFVTMSGVVEYLRTDTIAQVMLQPKQSSSFRSGLQISMSKAAVKHFA